MSENTPAIDERHHELARKALVAVRESVDKSDHRAHEDRAADYYRRRLKVQLRSYFIEYLRHIDPSEIRIFSLLPAARSFYDLPLGIHLVRLGIF